MALRERGFDEFSARTRVPRLHHQERVDHAFVRFVALYREMCGGLSAVPFNDDDELPVS